MSQAARPARRRHAPLALTLALAAVIWGVIVLGGAVLSAWLR